MQLVHSIVLILHFIGLAAVIGPFLLQLRKKDDYDFRIMLAGAITQVVTGLLLVGLAYGIGEGDEIDNAKIGVKLLIAIVVLVATILATTGQRKLVAAGSTQRPLLKWLHIAGGLAIVNVIIAVAWQTAS